MDSGNSGGSMQSSSGGEEELDSRVGSTPSQFFNHPGHFASISNPNQSPPTFFDHPFHNPPSFSQSPTNPYPNPNPPFNPDSLWSRSAPRSDPNITGSSSSSLTLLGRGRPISGSLMPTEPVAEQTLSNTTKNSKKRTRASRRAPTTVLTTDTSNFRQMVQEFTGVPAAPYSASPYSRRFDLFAPGSTMRSGPLEPLRPSVLKAQPMPFVNTTLNTTSFLNTFNSSTNNYQIGSDLGLVIPKQGTNLPNMENPNQNLSFQSHFNPNLKYPSSNTPIFGSNSQENSRIPSLDELGIGHENLNPSFAGFQGGGNSYQTQSRGDQEHLGSSYKGDSDHISSSKLKYCSVSTSDLPSEKGLVNVSSRGEGTVDSWICPSD